MRGVSSTELLATLAVVLIVLSAGIPGSRNFTADNRRAAQVNSVLAALERARSEAQRSGRVVTVCPSPDGAHCAPHSSAWHEGFITVADPNGAEPEIMETHSRFGGRSTLRASRSIANGVTFRPNGEPLRRGELAWCDTRGPAHARAIVLLPTGEALESRMTAGGAALSCGT